MPEKYVKNLSANIYLNAAADMGLRFEVISADYSLARIYGKAGALTVCKAFIGHDNALMVGAIQDKRTAHRLLESAGIPVPVHRPFRVRSGKSIETDSAPIFEFASKHYPVVVKPPIGKLGRGVYVGISNDDQLAYALSCIVGSDTYPANSEGYKTLLVEKQLIGEEYRALVCGGVLVDILRKSTGFVTGNGRDTIEMLIDEENRRRGGKHGITDKVRIRSHLALSGLTFAHVPESGSRITLDHTCYYPTGGLMERIDLSTIPPTQIEHLLAIARVSGLHLSGIDYICGELFKPWRKRGNGVVEVNTGTSSAIHYYAEPGPDLTPAKRVIELSLGPG